MNLTRSKKVSVFMHILLPALFVCVIYVAMIFVLRPVAAPLIQLAAMLTTDSSKSVAASTLLTPREEEDIWAWTKETEEPAPSETPALPDVYTGTVRRGAFHFPAFGEQFAYLSVENTEIDCGLYMGDSDELLALGAGMFMGSHIPGDGSTTLIAGHCCTVFSTLGECAVGDRIYLVTNYGNFVYEITETRIAQASDTTSYDLQAKADNLILYTCYPFNTPFSVSQRYFVYAKLVSGVKIDRG